MSLSIFFLSLFSPFSCLLSVLIFLFLLFLSIYLLAVDWLSVLLKTCKNKYFWYVRMNESQDPYIPFNSGVTRKRKCTSNQYAPLTLTTKTVTVSQSTQSGKNPMPPCSYCLWMVLLIRPPSSTRFQIFLRSVSLLVLLLVVSFVYSCLYIFSYNKNIL